MNKICTDIPQSKKLIELGIDVKTADMYWDYDVQKHEDYPMVMDEQFDDTCIPAWSLSALLGLMPFQIIENNQRYGFYQWKGLNSQGETYCFEYDPNVGTHLYETIHWNNPLDAAFEMVCWLKENNKL